MGQVHAEQFEAVVEFMAEVVGHETSAADQQYIRAYTRDELTWDQMAEAIRVTADYEQYMEYVEAVNGTETLRDEPEQPVQRNYEVDAANLLQWIEETAAVHFSEWEQADSVTDFVRGLVSWSELMELLGVEISYKQYSEYWQQATRVPAAGPSQADMETENLMIAVAESMLQELEEVPAENASVVLGKLMEEFVKQVSAATRHGMSVDQAMLDIAVQLEYVDNEDDNGQIRQWSSK